MQDGYGGDDVLFRAAHVVVAVGVASGYKK